MTLETLRAEADQVPTAATRPPVGPDRTPAISVRNVGKLYRIYSRSEDRLKQMLFRRFGRQYGHDFWALRNVSFDIERGDAVGVIGRNGSGKSTLLQILAGTLQPTEGSVSVNGRVSALLELGSGFNPEYTGEENVYLSGAILGISRQEMERRYDDIASFADIGEFLQQPVKSYSSGMYARLAFSVAVAVQPDILIVDEILAVGDYGFQQKCVARLRQMRDAGLTLFFVSHSPDSIKSICSRGLFLVDGQPAYWGGAEQAVDLYFKYIREQTNRDILGDHPFNNTVQVRERTAGSLRYGTGHAQIEDVAVLGADGLPHKAFAINDEIRIRVRLRSFIDATALSVSFLVRDLAGVDLLGTTTFDEFVELPPVKTNGELAVEFSFKINLHPGNFGISVAVHHVSQRDYSDNILFDQIDAAATFVVLHDPNRPVHYKFHCPTQIRIEANGPRQ